jgi:cell division protein FtsQ
VSERRAWPDRRQRRLLVPPVVDHPLAEGDDPPFLRPERRTRVRRQRGWTYRLIFALQLSAALLVTVSALWTGYSRVMASERLRVVKVEVRGSRFLSEGEVRELLGPAVGENILNLDIDSLKARLRSSPWVADATVTRTLPDTLRVQVRERVPLALAELERLYLMDGDGALIDIYGPRTAAFDLPIVRGLQRAEPEDRREGAILAGALLRDLGDLGAEVSEVEVEKNGDLRVVLKGAGEVVRMGAPPHRSRLLTFLSLRKELRVRCPRAEWFDLRFRDRIYVMQPPDAVTPAAIAAPAPAGAGPDPSTRETPDAPAAGREPEAHPAGALPAILVPASPPLAPEPGDLRVR